MNNKLSFFLVRNIDAEDLLENFLVTGVLSVLGIRLYLRLTGYPEILTARLHIAHVIFGGFLMMIALIMLLAYINREIRYLATYIGGLGFGAFIDELGKYITRDNNYFYQPTIALIYVTFVLIFLSIRVWNSKRRLSTKEYAVNALELTKEALVNDLDLTEKKRAMNLLRKADQKDPIVLLLQKVLGEMSPIPVEDSWFTKLRKWVSEYYKKLVRTPWFNRMVVVFFIVLTIFGMGKAIYLFRDPDSFSDWGELISTCFSGLFVLVGIYFLRRRKYLMAYESFRLSLLVSIFLVQFFLFYKEQLSAVLGLVFNILALNVLEYLILQKELSIGKKKKVHRFNLI